MPVDDHFAFTSEPALNLHHLLYAEAWAVEASQTGRRSAAQSVGGERTLATAPGYAEAIGYYRSTLINGDLLFDATLESLANHLIGRGGDPPEGWQAVFAPLLAEYQKTDWPNHDQKNRAWTTSVISNLDLLLPEALQRLERLYREPLTDQPIRVSTVYVGGRLPAYTSIHPTHVICSTTHPESQRLAAAEVVLHEASHAMVHGLRESIEARLDTSADGLGQLWHAVLFFVTGEVVARSWAERGVPYVPYVEATGLFDRAWPQFRQPITESWSGYLDGRWDWDSACDRLADAVRANE